MLTGMAGCVTITWCWGYACCDEPDYLYTSFKRCLWAIYFAGEIKLYVCDKIVMTSGGEIYHEWVKGKKKTTLLDSLLS